MQPQGSGCNWPLLVSDRIQKGRIAYVRPAAFQAKAIVVVEVLVVEKSFGQRFEGDLALNCSHRDIG